MDQSRTLVVKILSIWEAMNRDAFCSFDVVQFKTNKITYIFKYERMKVEIQPIDIGLFCPKVVYSTARHGRHGMLLHQDNAKRHITRRTKLSSYAVN